METKKNFILFLFFAQNLSLFIFFCAFVGTFFFQEKSCDKRTKKRVQLKEKLQAFFCFVFFLLRTKKKRFTEQSTRISKESSWLLLDLNPHLDPFFFPSFLNYSHPFKGG